jgi:uncharacterized phage-associated protein
MKLQRVVYLVGEEYQRLTGRPLLKEAFEDWPYGPVLPTLWHKFSCFGGDSITTYAPTATGEAYAVDEKVDRALSQAIATVWAATREQSGVELSRACMESGSAWRRELSSRHRH